MELLLLVRAINKSVVWTEVVRDCCCISEVYGFFFLDGLASYSIPEGGTIAAPGFPIVYLNDSTYDGYQERRWERLSCSLSVPVQILFFPTHPVTGILYPKHFLMLVGCCKMLGTNVFMYYLMLSSWADTVEPGY